MDRDYIINVILTGQDLLSGKGKKMAKDLEDSFRRVRVASENAIAGVPTRQRNELGQYTKDVQRLGGAWNWINDRMPTWRQAQKAFTGELIRQRNELGQMTKTVERHGGALGALAGAYRATRDAGEALNNRIPTWQRMHRAMFGTLERQRDEMGRYTKEVWRVDGALGALAGAWRRHKAEGESFTNVFRGARRAVADLEHGVRDLTRTERMSRELGRGPLFNFGYNFGRGINSAIRSMTRFNPAVGFMSMALILLVNIITDLVGALTALASAAAIAAAGLAGAFTAAMAQVVPVVGVAIVAVNRLTKVFAAVEAAEKQQAKTSNDAVDTARRRREALQRVADAQYAMAQALQAERDAQLELGIAISEVGEARRQAARELIDLSMARSSATLAERDAELALLEARRRLSELEADRVKDFERRRTLARLRGEADPTQLPASQDTEMRRARLDVVQAVLSRRRAEVDLARAIEDSNRAQRQGIEMSPAVVAAKRALERAGRGVRDAEHQAAQAGRELRDALTDMKAGFQTAAQVASQFEQAMSKLSPAEKRLVEIVQRVKKTWREATQPIADSIINAVGYALIQSEKLAKDPRLRSAFKELGETLGREIRGFSDFMSSPEQRGFFAFFTKEASKNAPLLRGILQSLIVLFEKLAKAASPLVNRLLTRLDDFLSDKAAGANVDRLTKFFDSTEKYITGAINLTGAFLRLIGAIIRGAAGPGLEGMKGITDQFNEWADWINKHPEKVRKFFEDSIKRSGEWFGLIKSIVQAINALGRSEGFRMMIRFIQETVVPIFETAAAMITVAFKAVQLFGSALALVGLDGVAKKAFIFLGAVILLSKTIPGAGALLRWLGMTVLPALIKGLFNATVALLRMGAAWLVAMGPVGWLILAGVAIAGLITWLGKWDEIMGIVMGVVESLGGVIKAVFTFIGDLIHGRWEKLWDDFLDIFKSIFKLWKSWITALPRIVFEVFSGILEKFGVLDDIKRIISRFGDWLGKKWKGIWGSLKGLPEQVLGGILDGIRGIVNGIIDGVNWVLDKIGLDRLTIAKWEGAKKKKTTTSGGPAGAEPGYADGGIVQPVPGGVYRVAEAGHQEAVIPLDPSKRSRAMQVLSVTMKALGMAEGGVVSPTIPSVPAAFGGIKDAYLRTVALGRWIASLGYRVGEHPAFGGIYPVHSETGYHYSRQGALDVNRDGPTEMVWLDMLHGALMNARGILDIAELIWRAKGHWNHLHVALGPDSGRGSYITGAAGAVKGLLTKGADEVKEMFTGRVGEIVSDNIVLRAIGGFLRGAAWDWLKGQATGALRPRGFRDGVQGVKDLGGWVAGQFDRGGWVPGREGQAVPAVVHAGEVVLNRAQQMAVGATNLARAFNGAVPWRRGQRRFLVGGGVWGSEGGGGSFSDPEVQAVIEAQPEATVLDPGLIDRIRSEMAALSGHFAGMMDFISEQSRKLALSLRQATVKMIGGKAVRVLSELQGMQVELGNLQTSYTTLADQNSQIRGALGSLRARLAAASDPQVRALLEAQIEELSGLLLDNEEAMQDNIEQQLQLQKQIHDAQVAAVDARFETLSKAASLRDRMAQLTGNRAGRISASEDATSALVEQKSGLEALLASAPDEESAQALRERIAELDVSIQESIRATDDLRLSTLQESFSQGDRTRSLQMRLAELQGDTEKQRQLLAERGQALEAQRTELMALLAEETDPEVRRALQDALLENAIATEENTDALESLAGSLAPQTWASEAWERFRVAIFDGMGGLLPQYQIPGMQSGGIVTRAGLFMLHAGEKVTPRDRVGKGETNISIEVNEAGGPLDVGYLARRMAFEMRTRGV